MTLSGLQKRAMMFIFGCMGVRIFLAYIAKNIEVNLLQNMGLPSFFIGVVMLILYFGNLRKTGAEVQGEKIWWDHLRPVHGLLYMVFGLMAFNQNKDAWMVLAADVMIGFLAWIRHHKKHLNVMVPTVDVKSMFQVE